MWNKKAKAQGIVEYMLVLLLALVALVMVFAMVGKVIGNITNLPSYPTATPTFLHAENEHCELVPNGAPIIDDSGVYFVPLYHCTTPTPKAQ